MTSCHHKVAAEAPSAEGGPHGHPRQALSIWPQLFALGWSVGCAGSPAVLGGSSHSQSPSGGFSFWEKPIFTSTNNTPQTVC